MLFFFRSKMLNALRCPLFLPTSGSCSNQANAAIVLLHCWALFSRGRWDKCALGNCKRNTCSYFRTYRHCHQCSWSFLVSSRCLLNFLCTFSLSLSQSLMFMIFNQKPKCKKRNKLAQCLWTELFSSGSHCQCCWSQKKEIDMKETTLYHIPIHFKRLKVEKVLHTWSGWLRVMAYDRLQQLPDFYL